MDWLTAIITISSVILGAVIAFIFDIIKSKENNKTSERNQNKQNLYNIRLEAYLKFLNALPQAYNCVTRAEGSLNEYSNALNRIYLVGSKQLIEALVENGYAITKTKTNLLKHNGTNPLKKIINIMRKELGYSEELETAIICLHTSD